ncbi:ABC transporter permease [Rhodococcus koreensis]
MGPLARWLLLRVAAGVVTLAIVSVLVFAATQALPGDVARLILGPDATADQVAQLRVTLGLDDPVIAQYFAWISGLLSGNLGTSLVTGNPVVDVVAPRLANSLFLVGISMLISIPLSIALGVFTAERRDRFIDRALLRFSMVSNAIPDFVLGILLVVLFGTTVFTWFPPVAIVPVGDAPWAHLDRLILPILTIVILVTTYLCRLVRSSFIDVLDSDYVQMAELKGLGRIMILFRHALPNAIGALIQAAAISAAVVLGGLVVVENVFNFNGIGTLLSNSIKTHDLPVIQAVVMIIATAFFVCNLVADLLVGEGRKKER